MPADLGRISTFKNLLQTMRYDKRLKIRFVLALLAIAWYGTRTTNAAEWSVAPNNFVALDTSASVLTVNEMSGVTYLGPSPTIGKHRFLTVQDDGSGAIAFDAAFDLNGHLVSAEAVSSFAISTGLDSEGVAAVGNSIFVSDENGPGVRQYSATTGSQLQTVSIPTVFTDNKQGNRGFESLAYDLQDSRLWTANEEALTVDGSLATSAAGTTVRLLELELNGNTVTTGKQYAYEVESIHGSDNDSRTRSGLAELVALPDGTLLALERSFAAGIPPYQSRIYEIDFQDATDVSVTPFDAGLTGETYTPTGKELLWSGSAGGGFGQNLEGLTVGPRLPSGEWILLGVVDNGGTADFLSGNTIVSFTASPTTAIPFDVNSADFDDDVSVDGGDFLSWQRGFGVTTLAGANHGDANHDGTVTAADLMIWLSQYGTTILDIELDFIPEPASLALLLIASGSLLAPRRR